MAELLESPRGQKILEEGRRIGFPIGYQLGLQQARTQALREVVLATLEARLGPVPPVIDTKIRLVSDPDVLRRLIRASLTAASTEEFAARGWGMCRAAAQWCAGGS